MNCLLSPKYRHAGPGLTSPQEYNQWLPYRHDASLLPMKEDLAFWLNTMMGVDLTADSLMERLDNGVVLCQLAQLLQEKMIHGINDKPFTRRVIHWRADATSGSFFARDNAANFLYWCRKIGVDEAYLFESEDLGTPPISPPPAAPTPRSSRKPSCRRSTGTNNILDDIVRKIIENPPCSCSTRFLVEKQPKGCYRIGDKVLYIRVVIQLSANNRVFHSR
ncbi:hypothetical protein F2P81_004470 [Scophthalmus maximus]|uniref:Growth arrest-specific protein 2-like n=1 Tax=Scophthalmus maximus TaxID=52904 RepID=A0A6A4TAW7_SCOMX|nr:hypothetical protein F2P81_004470 [Scophthalmus maximus]